MLKKKVLIIMVVIVAIIVGVIAYFSVSDLQQENKIKTELTEISELANAENIDMDKINAKLNSTVTKGEYAIVEKSAKQYLSDNFNNSIEMANLLNDENITKMLTVENYKTDGKEFKNTKAYLSKTIQKLEDCKNKYYEFFTEEKAMSYINDKNLDSYYTDFYKNEIVADTETQGNDKTVENAINNTISTLKTSEKIIDFLIENKNYWEIQDDNIAFSSDSLANKYNELANNL